MEETLSVYGRHIDLLKVREKMLKRHEALGIIRDNDNQYYAQLPLDQVYYKLREHGENANGAENTSTRKAEANM